MRTIKLHGEVGELYGEEWNLDVITPAEAIIAIESNRPGFLQYLQNTEDNGVEYTIKLGGTEIEPERIKGPFGVSEVFHIVPQMSGANSKGNGAAKIIVGAIIAIVAIITAIPSGGGSLAWGATIAGASWAPTAGATLLFGASLMLSGVSTLLTKTPEANNKSSEADRLKGHYFSGPVNTIAQGGPVPIGYGRLLVGAVVVSSGIEVRTDVSIKV
jgi:predicted phage tail protein